MNCKECWFHYKGQDDKYEHCHFEWLGWDIPPCEQEELDNEREIE